MRRYNREDCEGNTKSIGREGRQEAEELRRKQERERAERYRAVYTTLGLRIVAHEDGTLELTWKAGEGVSEVCVSRKCRAAATISSSSTLARSRGRTCQTWHS